MRSVETLLGLMIVAALTYFAFAAAGDDFPLNVAVGMLGFVVAAGLVLRALGLVPRDQRRDRRRGR